MAQCRFRLLTRMRWTKERTTDVEEGTKVVKVDPSRKGRSVTYLLTLGICLLSIFI